MRLADGPSKVALYEYDNGTLVVESFNDEAVTVQVGGARQSVDTLRNLETGEALQKLPGMPARSSFSAAPEPPASRFTVRIRGAFLRGVRDGQRYIQR